MTSNLFTLALVLIVIVVTLGFETAYLYGNGIDPNPAYQVYWALMWPMTILAVAALVSAAIAHKKD